MRGTTILHQGNNPIQRQPKKSIKTTLVSLHQPPISSPASNTTHQPAQPNKPTQLQTPKTLQSPQPTTKMHFNSLITLLTVAMTASALPAEPAAAPNAVVARTGGGGGGGGGGSCNNNQQPVCCNGLLGGLLCTVGLIAGTCNGEAYCCQTNSPLVSPTLRSVAPF